MNIKVLQIQKESNHASNNSNPARFNFKFNTLLWKSLFCKAGSKKSSHFLLLTYIFCVLSITRFFFKFVVLVLSKSSFIFSLCAFILKFLPLSKSKIIRNAYRKAYNQIYFIKHVYCIKIWCYYCLVSNPGCFKMIDAAKKLEEKISIKICMRKTVYGF